MRIEISDYKKLNQQQRTKLAAILNKYDTQWVFPAGIIDDIELSHKIIKHLSSETPRFAKPGPRVRYEVLDNTPFKQGRFGNSYRSLCTLSINDKGVLKVKFRKQGTERLIKEQDFTKSDDGEQQRVRLKVSALQKAGFFHSKPLVHDAQTSYIVMRELQGVDLFTFIAENILDNRQRYALTLAILQAFKEQIYDRGYVHRDIKPEKIILNSKDNVFQVYFTGYGTIKDKNHDDSLESIGTLLYAPPEFFQDGIITDHKYDIYCMGRVLMYVWGGYDSPERVNNTTGEQEALSPEYQNLFTHLEKIPVSKNKIKEIIKCMCQAVSKKRPDVDRVIESFDELSNQLQTACKRKVNFGF